MNSGRHPDCGCNHKEEPFMNNGLEELPLAMAYVPWQQWKKVLCADKALTCGTIFEELIMPFYGAPVGPDNTRERRCDRR